MAGLGRLGLAGWDARLGLPEGWLRQRMPGAAWGWLAGAGWLKLAGWDYNAWLRLAEAG